MLALGIGASASLFTIVNGVLLRPLPYKNSGRLVATAEAVLAADFRDIQRQTTVFERMALFEPRERLLTEAGKGLTVESEAVSADFLPMLGAVPVLGRSFAAGEYEPGHDNVVLLSHALWTARFHSNPGVLGRSVVLDSKPYTVIGVLPSWFQFRSRWYEKEAEVWLPLALNSVQLEQRGAPKWTSKGPAPDRYSTVLIARLEGGATLTVAQQNYNRIIAGLVSQYPDDRAFRGRRLYSLKYLQTGPVGGVLWPLFGGAELLLLVCCANVSGLILTRGLDRRREMAIRTVLGARRSQIAFYFMEESLVLSSAGAGVGLLFSVWAVNIFKALVPSGYVPRIEQARIDGWVLLFVLAAVILSAVSAGILPAMRCSRSELNSDLKGAASSRIRFRGRFRFNGQKCFLMCQIGAGMVLLVGVGLMGRSLWLMITQDPGFEPRNVTYASVQRVPGLTGPQNWNAARNLALFLELLERVNALPATKSAALANPAVGDSSDLPFFVTGQSHPRTEDMPIANFWAVTPEFFKTLHVPLIRGRYFTGEDVAGTQPTIIVNQSMARAYFAGNDPVGQYLTYVWVSKEINARIVGEIPDVKMAGLDQPVAPQIYLCLWQTSLTGGVLYVRTDTTPALLTAALREKMQETSNDLALLDVRPLADVLWQSSAARPRFLTFLLGAFAGLALLLTVVGVFGAAALNVRRRTHEIGIRRALGAQNKDVLGTVLYDSLMTSLIGVAAGTVAALALARLISSWLYGVAPTDSQTFIFSGLLLLVTCFLASYIPARRALHVDPAVVLRHE